MVQHPPHELSDEAARKHYSCETLVRQQAAWADLEPSYRKFAPKMYSYLRNHGADHSSAEDTVNEAFLKLYARTLNDYHGSQYLD
jgi:DNA-directed RNA polymerase specialized sigma24 family protein